MLRTFEERKLFIVLNMQLLKNLTAIPVKAATFVMHLECKITVIDRCYYYYVR